jgi:hypothetical protein
MDMQMKPIAAGLASLGRGGDSTLVHMTPREVAGLQALAMKHGGSLTINPQTGLPEAGFLSKILPMVAGLALAPMTAGTSLSFLGTPLGAGLLTGGLTALTSGSLKKGLMAGLGAFGGAGLGAGLAETGAAASAEAAREAAMQEALRVPSIDQLRTQLTVPPTVENLPAYTPSGYTPPYMPTGGEFGTSGYVPPNMPAGGEFAGLENVTPSAQPPVSQVTSPGYTPTDAELRAYRAQLIDQSANVPVKDYPMTQLEKMGKGLGYFTEQPVDAFSKFIGTPEDKKAGTPATGLGGGMKAGMYGLAAAAPIISGALDNRADAQRAAYNRAFAERQQQQQGGGYTPPPPMGFAPAAYYNPQTGIFGRQPMFYAQGGTVPQLDQRYPQSDITRAMYASSPQAPQSAEVLDGYGPKMNPFTGQVKLARGGLADLHEYAAGGKLLSGPGDGMSDDIPAVIKGPKPQRAALADGEFVVPADVVSHLGNGSTQAGAKRLYAMMDKVRMARVGTKKQGKQINADRFVPA